MSTTTTTNDRNTEVKEKAKAYALKRGSSEGTAINFASWAVNYAPEVQTYGNLFEHYTNRGPTEAEKARKRTRDFLAAAQVQITEQRNQQGNA